MGDEKRTGFGEIGDNTNLSFNAKNTWIFICADRHCELSRESKSEEGRKRSLRRERRE